MSYLSDYERAMTIVKPFGVDLGLPQGMAYSSLFPAYEIQSPNYTVPNAYTSAQTGYRTNEFAYSLTNRRSTAIANAKLRLYDNKDPKHPKIVHDNQVVDFLDSLNDLLEEPMFWAISEATRCIAGFSAWEIEYKNNGEPLHTWYMSPHFCSFLRGPNKVFRAIRYQPYGMPPMDIPAENILLFYGPENFDPLFPFLKWVSPTALSFPQLKVDTSMTLFLQDFIQHGARVNGLLSVIQTLTDDSAKEIRDRWIKQHGGTGNWTAPAVMGQGAKWEPMQMNFSDMTFPDLDARTETRMCNAFLVPTIVADARAGLDVASYNNVQEAHKNWHYKWVIPTWKMYAERFGRMMLPKFGIDQTRYSVEFDKRDVYELKEDIVKINSMWINAAKQNLITRDQWLEKIGEDPVDNHAVYVGQIIRENISVPTPETMGAQSNPEEQVSTVQDILKKEVASAAPKAPVAPKAPTPAQDSSAVDAARTLEKKNFTVFAKKRLKEGKRNEIPCYEFKNHSPEEEELLIQPYAEPGAAQVLDTIERALSMLEKV